MKRENGKLMLPFVVMIEMAFNFFSTHFFIPPFILVYTLKNTYIDCKFNLSHYVFIIPVKSGTCFHNTRNCLTSKDSVTLYSYLA